MNKYIARTIFFLITFSIFGGLIYVIVDDPIHIVGILIGVVVISIYLWSAYHSKF